jgi:hypothetical protein
MHNNMQENEPMLVSWLILHFALLPSCLPRWASYGTPSPLSLTPQHVADFLLFLLTNWTFVVAASTVSSARRWIQAYALFD